MVLALDSIPVLSSARVFLKKMEEKKKALLYLTESFLFLVLVFSACSWDISGVNSVRSGN